MSTKLNTEHRTRICRALLAGKFKARKDLQVARGLALASLIYGAKYDIEEQKKLHGLPDHYLPRVKKVKARILGDDVQFDLASAQPVPYEHRENYESSSCLLVEANDGTELGRLYRVFEEEKSAISREEDKLGREIRAILNSASTDKRLCTIWPEIRLVVEQVMGRPSDSLLPTVQVKDLNASLGFKAA